MELRTRRMELIARIYHAFTADDLYHFYARIRKKEPINWEEYELEEQRLNKSLTVFDAICYLHTQGLLNKRPLLFLCIWPVRDKKAWEYIASEIQYFAENKSVWAYMRQRIQEGLNRGFHRDIIPFTGFPSLHDSIPRQFRGGGWPYTPPEHMAFFETLNSRRWRELIEKPPEQPAS
jgi:hypothetical protein